MIAGLVATKGFDVLLVVHIVLAVAAFTVLLVLRAAARDVSRGGELAPASRRTFAGRREVAGRVVHLVPLSGAGLLVLSRGAYSLLTPFVLVGIACWAVAATGLETAAFPAQREVAASLRDGSDAGPAAERMRRAVELAAVAVAVAALVMVAAPT